jgi:beta-glucosidase/6-phospho-beta-glucosidase/beta-galactosidase
MKMPGSVEWLYKQWANLHRLIQDGVPIIGFTWYSLTHQVDWDTALREENGRIHEVGLYDLERNIMPVGKAFKRLISQWEEVLSNINYGWSFRH